MTVNNGENDYGVSFGRIMFLQKIIESNDAVVITSRHDDIVFEIDRPKFGDHLTVVCIDTYTASLEQVMRIVSDFPNANIIFVGGKWNGYTREAFDFCVSKKIGLYNAGEISGGLYRKDFWSYEKFDEEGETLRTIKG
ncbi:MAG: hypothetical protein EON91_00450 [Brevundimonas sp.]|uniref:hypothetical protein n=1 Tax=Brevundimonas sp. TaxID=1871086 RepID=UPI0012107D42|nr:hypothetical protein [Brevundimonas sp.]RZJ19547.1 MAG: hypothetical protein EON91_00450 [Brevundimonas sp.]